MVNAGKVNAGSSYFSPATFCESFPVSGRIPRLQNPFKYTCGFVINQKTLPAGAGQGDAGEKHSPAKSAS
jgi:hypothetical protein